MKKIVYWAIVAVSLIALLIRFTPDSVLSYFISKNKAGINITSTPSSEVYLNGKAVGFTPYQNHNLQEGNLQIKLGSEKGNWQGLVSLSKGAVTAVNRTLSQDDSSASGDILTLSQGTGVLIFSDPEGAEVLIDGKAYGQTPLKVEDLSTGEHDFVIKKDLYQDKSVKAMLPLEMMLSLNVDLAINPDKISLAWLEEPVKLASKAVVKTTPTGFLRVREKPSKNALEIAKINAGEEIVLLEELGEWVKIRLSNNTEGYAFSEYVLKKQ